MRNTIVTSPDTTTGKSKILIVDDTEIGRITLEEILLSPKYELDFANDGFQALQKAAEFIPDLILLDVMMPGMDGIETCQRLRADNKLSNIPVIMVTALDDRRSRLRGLRAGADDFITKPFDTSELLTRINTITRLNRYRRLLEERARFEWVVEQAEDGFLLLDEADRITYANANARNYLGLPTSADDYDEIIPAEFLTLFKRQYRCEPSDVWATWADTPNHNLDQIHYLIRPETDSSSSTWLEVTIKEPTWEAPSHRLIRMQDVTSRMTEQRSMWTFHSMIMHKLNTPLHIMSGSLQLLSPDFIENLEAKDIGDLAGSAMRSMQRLIDTVDDIMHYVDGKRFAKSGVHFRPRDLAEMIQQWGDDLELTTAVLDAVTGNKLQMNRDKLSEDVQQSLEANVILIESPTPDFECNISREAVEWILIELLDNAKKFHPEKMPQILVQASRIQPDTLQIQIKDNGITLSPEQLNKVWIPYYQAEKHFTGEVPGIGLGLTMVATYVWGAGGSCRIQNREDGPGVVVELELPQASH
ncbi:MAG: response regulator [Chloroflexota bacterium]